MKRATAAAAVLSALLAACAAVPEPRAPAQRPDLCAPEPLLISDVLLWDGERFVEGADVIASGGRIVDVARAGRTAVPRDVRRIDGRGATLLPGLIDSHTHFFDLGAVVKIESLAQAAELGLPATAPATLASGVTTARVHFFDRNYGPALARAAESDCFAAPRLVLGGPALLGGVPELQRSTRSGAADADDAIAKMRQARAAGANWISLGDFDKFPPDVLAAIVRESRASGPRLMVGVETPSQLELALEIGADSIDDGLGEIAYDLSDPRRYDRFTFALPLGYYRNLTLMRASRERIDDPRPLRFMKPETAEEVRQSLRRQFADEPATERERRYDEVAANFAALHRSGARIAVASDSGSQGQFHTDAIWNEMAAWHAAGISVVDTLRGATTIPADLLGQPGLGRLKPGARADFVLYRGDLRDGRFDPERVDLVAKGGVVLVEHGALTDRATKPSPKRAP